MSNTPALVDAADPLSLATILPEPLASAVKGLPRELLVQDEVTLTTLVAPTETQKRIKIQFWDEYEAAVAQKRDISLTNVIFGVCTRDYFLEFTRPARNVAWLISPRPSYKLRVAELIERGLDCIEQVFAIQPTEKNQISVRGLQMTALKMLDMRKHGGYTQRVEQKTLQKTIHENAPGGTGENTKALGEGTVEEIEAEVKRLEQKIRDGKNQNGSLLNVTHGASEGDVIDVTPGTESHG